MSQSSCWLPVCSHHPACCSKEDKKLFAVLLKPCLDISMWKGYDAADHSKNAAYYDIWYKRLVAAGATVADTLNKYQVNSVSTLANLSATVSSSA